MVGTRCPGNNCIFLLAEGLVFTKDQIIGILKEQEAGVPVADCAGRKHGVSNASLYKWEGQVWRQRRQRGDRGYQRATLETLIAIVTKHENKLPVFWRLRAYGDHQIALRFVRALPWNDEVAATISDAMLPHLEKLAEWQRWNCGLQTYFEIRERERRAKTKRCVAKAA